jgi:hypothetical protein
VLPSLLRRGSQLLHQQCWLWGCDIRCSGGNLLQAYGFLRQPDPEGKRSTQYSVALADGMVVRLWGSGFYYGSAAEGVFLNRFLFEPRLVRLQEGWQDPAALKRAPRYVALPLLCGACLWVSQYERWVQERAGVPHRRVALSQGPDPNADAEQVARAWHLLAAEFDALPGASHGRVA